MTGINQAITESAPKVRSAEDMATRRKSDSEGFLLISPAPLQRNVDTRRNQRYATASTDLPLATRWAFLTSSGLVARSNART